jgi:hypothetical protein
VTAPAVEGRARLPARAIPESEASRPAEAPNRQCGAGCGRVLPEMKLCSRCRAVWYCSRACQRRTGRRTSERARRRRREGARLPERAAAARRLCLFKAAIVRPPPALSCVCNPERSSLSLAFLSVICMRSVRRAERGGAAGRAAGPR